MLRKWIWLVLAAALLVPAGLWTVHAQETAGEEAAQPATSDETAQPADSQGIDMDQPAAESIFKHIPADCLGFVVCGNLKEATVQMEMFAGEIGMSEMLNQSAPSGLLKTFAPMAGMGEGFNPNGGVAIVILDFEKAGLDVKAMATGRDPGGQPPIVILVAGKDVESTFTNTRVSEDGETSVFLFGAMPTKAVKLGDYIALSPSDQALAMLAMSKSIENTLPAGSKKALTGSGLGLMYNFETIAPMVKKMKEAIKEQQEQQAAEGMQPRVNSMANAMNMMEMAEVYAEQMKSMAMGMKIQKEGLMVDLAYDYKPDTEIATMMQAIPAAKSPKVGRLPSLPYVFAAGGNMPTGSKKASKDLMQYYINMLNMVLADEGMEIPEDLEADIVKLGDEMIEEVTGVQYAIGGTKGKGLFGFSAVVECKNPENLKKLLARKADIIQRLVHKTVGTEDPDALEFSAKYVENVTTVGTTSVDVLQFSHPEMLEIEEDERAEMIKVLGEDQLRMMVAQADPKSLVLTFGGSTDFLGEALGAAQKGGTILKDPGVEEAMKYLPDNSVGVMFLSAKNAWEVIQSGLKAMGEESDLPEDFTFTGTTPIAGGFGYEGTTMSGRIYIPTATVNDMVQWIMLEQAASQRKRMEAQEAQPADDDF